MKYLARCNGKQWYIFPCKIPRIFDGSVQMYKKAYSMKNEHCNFVHFIFRHKLRSADKKRGKKILSGTSKVEKYRGLKNASRTNFLGNFILNVAPLNLFQSFSNFGFSIFISILTYKKEVGSFERVFENWGAPSTP